MKSHGDHSHSLTVKNVDRLSPTRVRLTVEFPADTVVQHERMTANRYSQAARIPGFRPGKAPLKMVMERYKEEILKDVVTHLVEAGFVEACEQTKLTPVNRPRLQFGNVQLNEGKPFEFQAEFEVQPEIELRNYKGVPLKADNVDASDDEVNKTVDNLRERMASLEPSDAKKPSPGEFVVAEIGFDVADGSKKETPKSVTVEVGTDRLIPEIDKALLALEVGAEAANVEATFPEDYHDASLVGKKATFNIRILEIKRKRLPDFDDAFAAQIKPEGTVESVRSEIRENILQAKRDEQRRSQRNEIVDYLIANHRFDVPSSLVERQAQALLQWLAEDMEKRGQKPGALKDDELTEIRKRAEQMVRSSLLLREIAQKENIALDEEKVRERVAALAEQFRKSPEETERLLDDRGMLAKLRDEVLTDQVFEFLIANAQRVEGSPRV